MVIHYHINTTNILVVYSKCYNTLLHLEYTCFTINLNSPSKHLFKIMIILIYLSHLDISIKVMITLLYIERLLFCKINKSVTI